VWQVDRKVTEAVCHVNPVSAHTVIRAKPHAVTWHNEVFHKPIYTCINILRMNTLEDGGSHRRQLQTKGRNCCKIFVVLFNFRELVNTGICERNYK
jgi:hypothetical protein